MIKIPNPFSRKKSSDEIAEDIDSTLEDLSLEKRIAILSYLISKNAKEDIETIKTKYTIDTSILTILKSLYIPKDALMHLSFIANKLVEMHPELLHIIATSTSEEIQNGVV